MSDQPQQAPELEWLEDGVPRAPAFQDTYFSRAGGLAETRHVFMAGNQLPTRWQGREAFTIAEFGFGTGLSFLTTLQALRQITDPPRLTFLSFERFPMTRDQLSRALSAFPDLAGKAAELLDVWSPKTGWSKLSFQGADLVLAIGDAREMIADVGAGRIELSPVDAWYLDGFSPSKNPELWGDVLLKSAYDLTAEDGTLATYSSAGWVRRNLISAGFSIEKQRGFAGKREMVVGRKELHTQDSAQDDISRP